MSENRCVCCGEIIPEGMIACPNCLVVSKRKTELKPCPFCGVPVTMVYNSFDDAFKVYHKGGMADGICPVREPIMLDAKSLADAAEAWNRRADDGNS